ncbi:ABC transporter ATP-binding protein [Vallitalea sp.]|jgi:ATP-binding cassette subfamily B protein|uniref:ABC transporter ATP-binding protein n=1 Tax=Vallitalea sp. TaxID=1882829 RepID=UPI0025E2AA86|nr:ABC transporter ATP-binding protein [Vallitalea sp.]MCT4688438.1 ABC transporter ATP-binding protein/permease [Vallitalea sp.]
MYKNIKRLLGSYYYDYKKTVYLSICDIFIGAIPLIIMMYIMVKSIDQHNLSVVQIAIYTCVLLSCFIIRKIFLQKNIYKLQRIGCLAIKDLRIKIGDHLQKINLGYFNQKSCGHLIGTLTTELHDLEVILTHHISEIFKISLLGILLTVFAFLISPYLAFFQLALIAIAITIVVVGMKKIVIEGKKNKMAVEGLVSHVIEYIEGIRLFKSFGVVGTNFTRLKKSLSDLKKSNIKTEFALTPNIFISRILIDLSFPMFIILGIRKLTFGEISTVSFISFIMINITLSSILKAGLPKYVLLRYLTLSIENLIGVENQEEMSYSENKVKISSYDIEFKNVTFSYEKNIPVLQNINFIARNGKTTALIGPSGSGKTTITNLIARFWDPQKGSVIIGNRDIRDINPNELLKNISMVFQDVYLLQDTVYENIRIGNLNSEKKDVIKAAKAANCHNFIMKMENGYDTIIGEGGFTLSAGERQRISIARALLKNAPIVLLDEATASLDADNEIEIKNAINHLTNNKTVIVIAHRLNSIQDADKIIVLKDGKIVEWGNHNNLIKNQKWYYDMYNQMQISKEWQV